MYVVVRSYSGQGASELFDLLGQREEDVKELISGVPGFVRYAAFRSGDGGMHGPRVLILGRWEFQRVSHDVAQTRRAVLATSWLIRRFIWLCNALIQRLPEPKVAGSRPVVRLSEVAG